MVRRPMTEDIVRSGSGSTIYTLVASTVRISEGQQ
jgi:hypothetical protein